MGVVWAWSSSCDLLSKFWTPSNIYEMAEGTNFNHGSQINNEY